MPEPAHRLKIFICHASQDKPIAHELSRRLGLEGWLDPWLAEEKLLPGMDWDLEIRKAVKASDAVVVCLSNHSVTKEGYVQRELRLVLETAEYKPEGTIFIIPLRLDDCVVPTRLERWQYIDFFPPRRRDAAYGQLRQSLSLRAKALGIPVVEPPVVAPKPSLQGATMPDPITAARIRDIESHLRQGQKLLKEYEEKLRLSSDPKEQEHTRKEIKALRSQINKHQKELDGLAGKKPSTDSKPTTIHYVNTGGGAYIAGDVKVDGGDFVGRDKVDRSISVDDISNSAGVAIGDESHGSAISNETANGPADSPLPGKSPQA